MTIGKNTSVIDKTVGSGTAMVGWQLLQDADDEHSTTAADFSTGWGLADHTASLHDLQALFSNTGTQCELTFYSAPFGGENPADADTATIEIVGFANNSPDETVNPPIYIAKLAAVVGTMPVEDVTDALWFDTLVDSFADFEGDAVVYDSGNNRAARLVLDCTGLRYIRAYVSDALGVTSAGEAPSVAMAGRVF